MAKAATATAERKLTEYVVLRRYDGPIGPRGDDVDFEVWEPMRAETAKNSDEACKKASAALGENGEDMPGDWKAVPLSSWKGGLRVGRKTISIFEQLDAANAPAEEVLA